MQVLTANYNAEYGRTSGGPLPYITHQHWDRSLFSDAPWRFQRTLDPTNSFFNPVRTINDPLTGKASPGNIIPKERLSPNGIALLNAYPVPTPGLNVTGATK